MRRRKWFTMQSRELWLFGSLCVFVLSCPIICVCSSGCWTAAWDVRPALQPSWRTFQRHSARTATPNPPPYHKAPTLQLNLNAQLLGWCEGDLACAPTDRALCICCSVGAIDLPPPHQTSHHPAVKGINRTLATKASLLCAHSGSAWWTSCSLSSYWFPAAAS